MHEPAHRHTHTITTVISWEPDQVDSLVRDPCLRAGRLISKGAPPQSSRYTQQVAAAWQGGRPSPPTPLRPRPSYSAARIPARPTATAPAIQKPIIQAGLMLSGVQSEASKPPTHPTPALCPVSALLPVGLAVPCKALPPLKT